MLNLEALLADAYARFQRGDFAGASAVAQRLLDAKVSDPRLSALAGMLAIYNGEADQAVHHLRLALTATPETIALRANLAFALVQTGSLDEAKRVAAVGQSPQLRRITAYVDQQQGRSDLAIAGYKQVLVDFPEDFESWSNLGVLLLQRSLTAEAESALRRSIAIQPMQQDAYRGLSSLLAACGRRAERRQLMREASRMCPSDGTLLVELGLAEGATDNFVAARDAYERALQVAPLLPAAYLEYGMMLERLHSLDELDKLIDRARKIGCNGPEIDFLTAWALRRRGRLTEAKQLVDACATGLNPGRRAQLIGEIADGLGNTDEAFAAFSVMNQESAKEKASELALASDFPGEVAATISRLTPAAVSAFAEVETKPTHLTPIFIVGFPRSGTTLLDTLLMNAPELQVLEELPVIERIEALLDKPDDVYTLSVGDVGQLRAAYFDILVETVAGFDHTRRVVDKFPMNMVRVALIYRLFPDAKFVFVERHPCDAVLSCFIARFQINRAMVHFQDLASTARLYDLAMHAWTRAARLLPVSVHTVRYERLVERPEDELRSLINYLRLPWRRELLDNQHSSNRRGYIATPSYAQVTQPIYKTALNRWTRYRQHLSPVMHILLPWVERLGYEN